MDKIPFRIILISLPLLLVACPNYWMAEYPDAIISVREVELDPDGWTLRFDPTNRGETGSYQFYLETLWRLNGGDLALLDADQASDVTENPEQDQQDEVAEAADGERPADSDPTVDSDPTAPREAAVRELMQCVGTVSVADSGGPVMFLQCDDREAGGFRLNFENEAFGFRSVRLLSSFHELDADRNSTPIVDGVWASKATNCAPAEAYNLFLKEKVNLYSDDSVPGLLFPGLPVPTAVIDETFFFHRPYFVFAVDPCRLYKIEVQHDTRGLL